MTWRQTVRTPRRLAAVFRRRFVPECAIGLIVFCFASGLGMTYVAVWGQDAPFYQREYGPAVMLASGHGFVNPAPSSVPGLEDFLSTKANYLDASRIPSSIQVLPLTQLQARWLYLLYAAGFLWSFFGISWIALLPLYGIFFGLASVSTYALFRLGSGTVIAIVGASVCMLSPFNLYFLPFLRDYSKVPFIITAIAILGYLIKYNLSWSARFAFSVVLGGLLGFGLGFRKDVIICIPPAILVLAFLIPGNPWKQKYRRVCAIGLLMAGFLATGWPLLRGMHEKGGTTSHVLILGLMEPFDEALGIGNTPYSFGHLYNDAYVYSMVESFEERRGSSQPIPYGTPAYDGACKAVYSSISATFPADILFRWYSASRRIADYAPFYTEDPYQEWMPNPVVYKLFQSRWRILGWLSGYGVLVVSICVLALSTANVRYGLAFSLLVLYFTGYASLQFSQRHFFHLEICIWWPIFFLLSQILHRAQILIRSLRFAGVSCSIRKTLRLHFWAGMLRAGIVTLVLVLVLSLPLIGARMYQKRLVNRMYDRCKALPVTAVPTELLEENGTAWISFRSDFSRDLDRSERRDQVFTSYFVAEFNAIEPVVFGTYYSTEKRYNDFRHRVEIDPPGSSDSRVRYYFPVYEASANSLWGRREFMGLLLRKESLPFFNGMYRVTDFEETEVLLPLRFTANGSRLQTHTTMNPYALPFYSRRSLADRENVLVNGDFDVWLADGVPEGFAAPRGVAHVEPLGDPLVPGSYSAKITWSSAPGPTAVGHRFRTQPVTLESSSTYELFVEGYNPSMNRILISAWQIVQDSSGEEHFVRLSPTVILFEPNSLYLCKAGRFSTLGNETTSVVLAVDCEGEDYPTSAYLDNFSLMRIK